MFPEWAKKILKNDEFTAKMHSDILASECSFLEVMIMAAYAETKQGISLKKACENNNITIEDFKNNYNLVYPQASFEKDFPNY